MQYRFTKGINLGSAEIPYNWPEITTRAKCFVKEKRFLSWHTLMKSLLGNVNFMPFLLNRALSRFSGKRDRLAAMVTNRLEFFFYLFAKHTEYS